MRVLSLALDMMWIVWQVRERVKKTCSYCMRSIEVRMRSDLAGQSCSLFWTVVAQYIVLPETVSVASHKVDVSVCARAKAMPGVIGVSVSYGAIR